MTAAIGTDLRTTVVAAATVCAGCSAASPAVPATSDAGIGPDTGGLYPSQLPPDFHCEPTLESVHDAIFLTSCAWDSCHGANNAQWGLNLVTDVATVRAELVDVPSATCKGWKRVVGGDPEHSLLWSKVSQHAPACGERMPWGVVPLPAAALDCIQGWIRNQ